MTGSTIRDVYGADTFVAITPSDSTTYAPTDPATGGRSSFRAIYVGVGGDVALMPAGSTTAVTFKNVPTGTLLPVQPIKVMATNTTATNLVGLF